MSGKFGVTFVLVVLLVAVSLEQSDAFRVRFRVSRIRRNIIRVPLCRYACSTTCVPATNGSAAPVCSLVCKQSCDRTRRSTAEAIETDQASVVVPMSRDFDRYDLNEDGEVTIQEFADALNLTVESGDVHTAFDLADRNADGVLNEDEFQDGPFVFDEGDFNNESLGDDVTDESLGDDVTDESLGDDLTDESLGDDVTDESLGDHGIV